MGNSVLGNLFEGNVNITFDTPSLVKAGATAVAAGIFILLLSKVIDRFIK